MDEPYMDEPVINPLNMLQISIWWMKDRDECMMNEWMNEIVYCYSVKLYIIHNIDMVHIIVDKHMNKINKYIIIAKGYRIAVQRF